jgi:hypothetical protein
MPNIPVSVFPAQTSEINDSCFRVYQEKGYLQYITVNLLLKHSQMLFFKWMFSFFLSISIDR